jgi:hypothetical protein
MGIHTKENRKLLDYQLSDFLELKLGTGERRLISRLKQELFQTSAFEGPSLYEFPAVGTANACLILSNGLTAKLKQIFLLDSDGSIRKIAVR